MDVKIVCFFNDTVSDDPIFSGKLFQIFGAQFLNALPPMRFLRKVGIVNLRPSFLVLRKSDIRQHR